MSETEAAPTTPHASKAEFLNVGICATTLSTPLDCSICREPLAVCTATASPPPKTETAALYRFSILPCTDHDQASSYEVYDKQTAELDISLDSSEDPVPEPPVRINPCNHIFGSMCLSSWFEHSTSNRCPECNIVLFPQRVHLALRRPDRTMRLEFARFIECEMEDEEAAMRVRQRGTSGWVGVLIRDFVIEMHRAMGYDVTWEYVCDELAGEEEEEEEEEEMVSEDEDEIVSDNDHEFEDEEYEEED